MSGRLRPNVAAIGQTLANFAIAHPREVQGLRRQVEPEGVLSFVHTCVAVWARLKRDLFPAHEGSRHLVESPHGRGAAASMSVRGSGTSTVAEVCTAVQEAMETDSSLCAEVAGDARAV